MYNKNEKHSDALTLFETSLTTHTLNSLADELCLSVSTLKRWQSQRKVPNKYKNDLCRINGHGYDLRNMKDLDQFYTHASVAESCFTTLRMSSETLGIKLDDYVFIDPSAGTGRFYDIFPEDRRIGMDISPRGNTEILEQDFLTWRPPREGKYIVVGNPPFGLRGHLALQFINHASEFADITAFILPQLFGSDGKGAPGKRVKTYSLAYSESLRPDSFTYPDGRTVNVSTVFQVWTKSGKQKIPVVVKKDASRFIKVFSLSDGGTPSTTRNKERLNHCDIYLPSTCFSGMRAYPDFESLPHRRGYGVVILQNKNAIKRLLSEHDWEETSFRSTNGALNLRTSLIMEVVAEAGFYDYDN